MITKVIGIALFLTFITKNAYGYIDPGTGSYILQIIIAGIAAGLYAIKYFWSSIKIFLQKIFSKKKKQKPVPPRPPVFKTPMQAKKK